MATALVTQIAYAVQTLFDPAGTAGRLVDLGKLANYGLLTSFTPAALFTTGVNGTWYDPSDITRYMSSLGPELVTNGDFSNGTTGWTVSNGTQTVSSSELTITATGASYPSTQQVISCVVGKTYVLTATVRKGGGASSAGVQINGVGGVYTSSVSNVSLRYQFVASFTSYTVAAVINGSTVAGDTATFDNISVQELTDISTATLFQDAAGTTPVTAVEQPVGLMLDKSKGLVLGPELVTQPIDVSGSSFGVVGSGVVRTTTSFTTGAAAGGISIVGTTGNVGKFYKISLTFTKSDSTTQLAFRGASTDALGATTASSGAINVIVPVTSDYNYVYLRASAGGCTVTITSCSVRELPGNHAYNPTPVGTANFPVLQQDGTGRYYLAFNGVNQWLQTNSIDFTYGDKMFVCAGVRKLSDAIPNVVIEFGSDTNTVTGSFHFVASASGSADQAALGDGSAGAIYSIKRNSGFVAPVTTVLSAAFDRSQPIASATSLRTNQIAATTTLTNGTLQATFGNYPLYIGARAGSAAWFNGRLYGLVVAGKQTSTSEITNTEAWLNQKTGAY